jgi:hypothetical protein
MTVRSEHQSDNDLTRLDAQPVRYLVVGREGSLALGSLLAKLFRSRGLLVKELISFDHRRMLTLYEIGIQGATAAVEPVLVDLMICLNDEALDYEPRLRRNGTLLLDANTVTRHPQRADVDVVEVPAFSLVQDLTDTLSQDAMSRFDLALSSLLGSLEAVENEYPDADSLSRVLGELQVESKAPFLMAVYRGYDWIQETRMRGKSPGGGVLN